jgi:hypothetical protein
LFPSNTVLGIEQYDLHDVRKVIKRSLFI